jgi:hypothetical protein
VAVAHVLSTPPASLQLVDPLLETPEQTSPLRATLQLAGAPPGTLLCVNTIAGCDDEATAGVPTRSRLFVSPVKPVR